MACLRVTAVSAATLVDWPDLAAASEADPTTLHKDAEGHMTCLVHNVRWADHTQPCWCCDAGIPPLERSTT
jgi:hypothetical protein